MRYAKRLLLPLLCSAFTLTLFLGFPAAPVAHADSIPPLQWSEASLGNLAATNLVTTPSGGVVVGCGNNATNAFSSFTNTGISTSLANSSTFDVEPCVSQAAVDSNGVLYTVAYDNGSPVLAAYNGTTLEWEYPLPCGGNLGSLVVGANGKIYATLASGNGCSWGKLIGVEPNLAAGQTTPATDFSTYLYNGPLVTGSSLVAYDNGLVVQLTNGLSFFDYNGNEAATEPGSLNLAPHYGRQFTATTDGRVFVPMKADSGTQTACGDQNVVGSIDAYDPGSSTPTWSFTGLPQCSDVYELHANYRGGVLIYLEAPTGGFPGGSTTDKLMMIQDGSLLWQSTLPATDSNGNLQVAHTVAVDLNGDVAWQYEIHQAVTINGATQYLPAVGFTLINGWTGAPLTQFLLAGDGSTYGYRLTNRDTYQVALAKDTVYLAARKCSSIANCSGEINLFAANVAGARADYPRGAILTHNQPWLNYVAMGDSFSAGQGVPSFMSPSDSDGCHRSYDAYPELLDGNPNLRLHLTNFVACSGATTYLVKNGQNGEDAQINVLNSSTDVVSISVGGNDIGFNDFVMQCLFLDCSNSASNQVFFDRIANDLPSELNSVYDSIVAHASNVSKIYVVGYPQILAATSCSDNGMSVLNAVLANAHAGVQSAIDTVNALGLFAGVSQELIDAAINAGQITLSDAEMATARQLVQDLDNQIAATVAARQDSRFVYVDPLAQGSPFTGHELCSDVSYFNGLDLANQEYSYHPNQDGQGAYWSLIAAQA